MKTGDQIQCQRRGWRGFYIKPYKESWVWVQWDGIPGPSLVEIAELDKLTPETRPTCWERIMAD